LNGRNGFFVAAEGMPVLLAMAAVTAVTWLFAGAWPACIPLVLLLYLYLIFHDPHRTIASAPLGVVSPVDGTVLATVRGQDGLLEGDILRVTIRVTSLGTYTARAPVEGKIMDLHALSRPDSPAAAAAGLWLRTDEGQDVVLKFRGNRFGIAPRAFLRYGERVGQGQRCAYLRLTKFADVELPADSRILVTEGQRLSAGEDLLARLPQGQGSPAQVAIETL
jgi:phosphatidylserine decarboxylase